MGQLIIPNEIKIQGPWILQESELDELGSVIEIIESKLEEALHFVVEKEAKEKFDEFKRYDENITLDTAKQIVIERYPYKNARTAALISKNRTKIVDDSLIALLKDKNLNEFCPSELFVEITKGPIEFQLEISPRYGGELQTRLKIDDNDIADDINYRLNKWIRKNRPNWVLQKLSSPWFLFATFPAFFFLAMISLASIESDKISYEYELHNQAEQILIDGLSKEETQDAVEIILKLETDFLPKNYKAYKTRPDKKSILFYSWGVLLLITIVLLSSPKTIIGLGRNRWKAWFFKKWRYFVFVFIPVSIVVPILISRLF